MHCVKLSEKIPKVEQYMYWSVILNKDMEILT
jgi:hypothetical protein